MMRISVSVTLGLFGGALVLGSCGDDAASQPAASKPNIVLILADDLGAGHVGAYGYDRAWTPRIDELASEGMRFETAWATPVCSPTRVELLTGQYAHRTGWYGFIGRAFTPKRESPLWDVTQHTSIADVAKSAGYATALAGKWQLMGTGDGLVRDSGFDEYMIRCDRLRLEGKKPKVRGDSWEHRNWHPCLISNGEYVDVEPDDYGPDLVLDFALDFMTRHRDEPFLLYYPAKLVHGPHESTPRSRNPADRDKGGFGDSLRYLDYSVGKVIDHLEDLGLTDDTVLIFTGDNGTAKVGKEVAKEIGVRVPLVVRWPGVTPDGTVTRALMDFSDFLPTIAEISGAGVPGDYPGDGKSLVPVLKDPTAKGREWIASFHYKSRLLRTDRFLLEGDGTFFDCHGNRGATESCTKIKRPRTPEQKAARELFDELLEQMPAPDAEKMQLVTQAESDRVMRAFAERQRKRRERLAKEDKARKAKNAKKSKLSPVPAKDEPPPK
jgi:arylsulfatase A